MIGICNLFDDFIEQEDSTNNQKETSDHLPDDYLIPNYTKLYKVPKYLEMTIFLSIAIFINGIIYNLIILPVKTIVMSIKYIFRQKINLIKYKTFLLKLFLFAIGIIIKNYLEQTYPLYLIHHKLRSLRGLKIFAFLKIIEFMTILLNRFHKDYDIQLITIIEEKKMRKKIIALALLIISFSLHIICLWSYLISMSITLHDSNSDIYPLLFKVNYIELKKCGKPQKKKNLMNQLTTDIFDRFFNYACLICVLFQGYHDNKFTSHNIVYYFYRISFIILFEILFDWVKDFIIFRISTFNPSIIKLIAFEIGIYHEKLRYNCLNSNGASKKIKETNDPKMNKYLKYLEEKENLIVGKQYHYERYIKYIDYDNVLCLTLQTNILIYCLMVTTVFAQKIQITLSLGIFIVIALFLLRKVIQFAIGVVVIGYFNKTKGKVKEALRNDAAFYLIDPMNQIELEEEKEEIFNYGANIIRSRKASYDSNNINGYELKEKAKVS